MRWRARERVWEVLLAMVRAGRGEEESGRRGSRGPRWAAAALCVRAHCSGGRVRGSGCAAPAQQRGPASLERCRVGSAGFLWCLLLFRIPPEGSQGFQNGVTGS